MTDTIRLVSRDIHGGKRWLKFSDYRFAASSAVVPVAAAELAKAALVYPLAFVQTGTGWSLMAVLGLTPGDNLFVAPNGKWASHYIPAAFRGYPFRLSRAANGNYSLAVDEGSGLVVDGPQGTPFFDESGSPTKETRQVLDFLVQTARSTEALSVVCASLAQAGLIEPWPLTVKDGDQERQVAGLNRINEAALNGLSHDGFLSLRRAGALPVAYAQLLSVSNLATLGRLADLRRRAQAQAKAAASKDIDLDQVFSLSNGSTVDWDLITKPE